MLTKSEQIGMHVRAAQVDDLGGQKGHEHAEYDTDPQPDQAALDELSDE